MEAIPTLLILTATTLGLISLALGLFVLKQDVPHHMALNPASSLMPKMGSGIQGRNVMQAQTHPKTKRIFLPILVGWFLMVGSIPSVVWGNPSDNISLDQTVLVHCEQADCACGGNELKDIRALMQYLESSDSAEQDAARASLWWHADQLSVMRALLDSFVGSNAVLRDSSEELLTQMFSTALLPEYVTAVLQRTKNDQERQTWAAWMIPHVENMTAKLMSWRETLHRVLPSTAVEEGMIIDEILAYIDQIMDRFLILRDAIVCPPSPSDATLDAVPMSTEPLAEETAVIHGDSVLIANVTGGQEQIEDTESAGRQVPLASTSTDQSSYETVLRDSDTTSEAQPTEADSEADSSRITSLEPLFVSSATAGQNFRTEPISDASAQQRLGNALINAGYDGKVSRALLDDEQISIGIYLQTGTRSAASYNPSFNWLYLGPGFFEDPDDPKTVTFSADMKPGDLFNELWHAYYDQVVEEGSDAEMQDMFDTTQKFLRQQQVRMAGGEYGTETMVPLVDLESDFEILTDEYISQLVDRMGDHYHRLRKQVRDGRLSPVEAQQQWEDLLAGQTLHTTGIHTYVDSSETIYTIGNQPPEGLTTLLAERFGMISFVATDEASAERLADDQPCCDQQSQTAANDTLETALTDATLSPLTVPVELPEGFVLTTERLDGAQLNANDLGLEGVPYVPSEPISDTTGVFYGESGESGGELKRVITGYTIPLNESTITSETVTLHVDPPDRVDHVVLRWNDPEDRATFDLDFKGTGVQTNVNGVKAPGGIWRDSSAGTIQFRVKGKNATPKDTPDGDTAIIAWDGSRKLAKVHVVVVIPHAIDPDPKRPEVFEGVVSGKNRAAGPTTSPGYYAGDFADGVLAYVTFYGVEVPIQVVDQFSQPATLYAGKATIEEKMGGVWLNINQPLRPDGSYIDPTGAYGEEPLGPDGKPQNFTTTDEKPLEPQVTEWERDGAHNPYYKVTDIHGFAGGVLKAVQELSVRVGGHEILPKPEGSGAAIQKREVRIEAVPGDPKKAKITITWPK